MAETILNFLSTNLGLTVPMILVLVALFFLYRGLVFIFKILLYLAIFIIAAYVLYLFVI